ncbi:hypothetical protein CERSUDRAFT_96986 [Gelatoporia subvermispora B]|uniref:XPG-I domain-containing protein n=1 Tax=Ceriporiopsis subvermispora (strain B) TaxID=914234 RepID=M2R8N4_CERS8|nr:hypothetical protein CERSUDRAFT_96986 [Gelatoporia subvermispora B]
MGVPGLWEVLRPAGETRSLTHLAVVDGFEANPAGARGFRVGIDASIWFFHATYGREGENPELRTLFFRCTRLMSMPFLPLFVFDGPKRPEFKRGKRVSGKNNWMEQGMQEIIHAFGFEWRKAPGEAEAELAYLNRIGVIDAVLSDDVDTFLFGAAVVVRNPSVTLSGNRGHSLKNAAGRDDGNHVAIYKSSTLAKHENVRLTQGGMILFGILCGGDYHQAGLMGCGATTAHALAKCGFGDSLLEAVHALPRELLSEFLEGWREEIRQELKTNSKGHLGRKMPSLAKKIPEDFPNIDVLLSYTNPITSESRGKTLKDFDIDWVKEPDLGRVAGLCEMYFEWGVKPIIIKRFRTVLWPSAVLRILRRSVLLADKRAAMQTARLPTTPRKNPRDQPVAVGTPSKMIAKHFSELMLGTPRARSLSVESDSDGDEEEEPLIVKIHSSRVHASTDGVLEYRLEIAPAQLVRICEAGVRGLRRELPADLSDSMDEYDDEDDGPGQKGKGKGKGKKKPPPDPMSHLRIWLPACMVRMVEPELVEEFEAVQAMKDAKKAAKEERARAAAAGEKIPRKPRTTPKKKATKPTAVSLLAEEEEESSESEPPTPVKKKTTGTRKAKTSETVSPARQSKPVNVRAAKATVPKSPKAPRPKKSGEPAKSKILTDSFVHVKPGTTQDKGKGKAASRAAEVSALFADTARAAAVSGSRGKISEYLNSDSDLDERFLHTLSKKASSGPTSCSLSKPSAPLNRTSSAILSALEADFFDTLDIPERAAPVVSAACYEPRPFPLLFDTKTSDSLNTDQDDPFGTITPPRKKSKSPPARRRQRISDSDHSNEVPLQKSPRKSKYASPRSPRTATPARELDTHRAVSPSPMRARPGMLKPQVKRTAAPKKADISIISISSDSEPDAPPSAKPAPLQLAKARTKPPARPAAAKSAGTRRQVLNYNPNDVIDLT